MNKKCLFMIVITTSLTFAFSIGFALGTYIVNDNLNKEKEISVYDLLLRTKE